MFKRFLCLAVCIVLAGCAGQSFIQPGGGVNLAGSVANPVTPTMVFNAEAAYVGARSFLVAYHSLTSCKVVPQPCQDAAVFAKLRAADKLAMADIHMARNYALANDRINLVSAYDAMQKAINAVTQIRQQYGIGT